MGRKINVELTAGGGGNSDIRRKKIEEKNVKVEEDRKADQEKEKKEKESKKHIKFDENGEPVEQKPKKEDDEPEIHPSRRRMVKKWEQESVMYLSRL